MSAFYLPPYQPWFTLTDPQTRPFTTCVREKNYQLEFNLLGLGLKFCLQKRTPQPKLSKSMERFRHDVRLKY
eukprot:scaffold293127_cov28-Attheya_sp.AAC.1